LIRALWLLVDRTNTPEPNFLPVVVTRALVRRHQQGSGPEPKNIHPGKQIN